MTDLDRSTPATGRTLLLVSGLLLSCTGACTARTWPGLTGIDHVELRLRNRGHSEERAQREIERLTSQVRRGLALSHPSLRGDYEFDLTQWPGWRGNGFGDVCRGRRVRWTPSEQELLDWLETSGYTESDCGCECGQDKVATWIFSWRSDRDGQGLGASWPLHISRQQEDCTWRSVLPPLGVLVHDRPEQLYGRAMFEHMGTRYSEVYGATYVAGSGAAPVRCWARARPSDRPGGELLDCGGAAEPGTETGPEDGDSDGGRSAEEDPEVEAPAAPDRIADLRRRLELFFSHRHPAEREEPRPDEPPASEHMRPISLPVLCEACAGLEPGSSHVDRLLPDLTPEAVSLQWEEFSPEPGP